ncbi:MAG: hypothetical protein R3Y11_00395 [Pseudomonadota bacterium]
MLRKHGHIRLETMSLPVAFSLAVSSSVLSRETIANYMGWTPDKAARFFNKNDDYWPSLPHLPKLCHVLGNTILPEWAFSVANKMHREHAKGYEYAHSAPQGDQRSAQEVLTVNNTLSSLTSLSKEFTDVLKVCGEAVLDGDIDAKEARRIVRELEQVVGAATTMMVKADRLCQQLQGNRRK